MYPDAFLTKHTLHYQRDKPFALFNCVELVTGHTLEGRLCFCDCMDNDDDDMEMQTLLASSKVTENRSAFFSHSATRRELMEEALSELSFKPSMFFKTLLYEPFPFPIPMLICRLLENKHSARNRDFNNCMGPMFFWFWAGFLFLSSPFFL